MNFLNNLKLAHKLAFMVLIPSHRDGWFCGGKVDFSILIT